MDITPINMVRKPFAISAVQITDENLDSVAAWCGGQVITILEGGVSKRCVVVFINQKRKAGSKGAPITRRAFVGEWVTKNNDIYRVYTDDALKKAFQVPAAGSSDTFTIASVQSPLSVIPAQS